MATQVTAAETERWRELDRRHHLHPFSNPAELAGEGVRIITRAEGCWLWDSEGNRILDGMAGLWCVNVGYGRAELVEAARRQMATLPYYNTFFQTTTPPTVELAARLAELAPAGIKRVFFTNSGSEANDTAVKLVRFYWNLKGKPEKKLIAATRYHGVTIAREPVGPTPHAPAVGPALPGFEHVPAPYWYADGEALTPDEFGRHRRGDGEEDPELGPEKVACVHRRADPGRGRGDHPAADLWAEVQPICRDYDLLLLADEVICGFGRTANGGASRISASRPTS